MADILPRVSDNDGDSNDENGDGVIIMVGAAGIKVGLLVAEINR